jgi:hypothetical protein
MFSQACSDLKKIFFGVFAMGYRNIASSQAGNGAFRISCSVKNRRRRTGVQTASGARAAKFTSECEKNELS